MNLQSALSYQPQELKFGTSGRRGEVVHLTDLEIYINALAELEYLQSLPPERGGIVRGEEFYFALDLRPSSARLASAVEHAIDDAGMRPVNMGRIPTPALMYYAVAQRKGSIMVTGSHIPFDRNGYKLNTSAGELLKEHEEPVNRAVGRVRERIYGQPFAESLFNQRGLFKGGSRELGQARELGHANDAAASFYVHRYTDFFGVGSLSGYRLAAYQHSAVGRDMLVDILERLGAEVVACGRRDEFVPIDTENIDDAQLATIQQLADVAGKVHAVVSTDGDSDRPLLLGIENGAVRFFGGDLVGMLVAEFLGADAVVVPITCNDAIDRGGLRSVLEPKTRIGSPYVIAGMEQARAKGRRAVCGWEANGGFLTGSDIELQGRVLQALPTRDALLPLLAVLKSAKDNSQSLVELFAELPRRYSRAALLKNYPREQSRGVVERFSVPGDATRQALERIFAPRGFPAITRLDYTDGVRIYFVNGDVVHFRPSGNADEFRIYAVAESQTRADEIVAMGVAEPDGILRSLQ
jgi:phosphomannomutase